MTAWSSPLVAIELACGVYRSALVVPYSGGLRRGPSHRWPVKLDRSERDFAGQGPFSASGACSSLVARSPKNLSGVDLGRVEHRELVEVACTQDQRQFCAAEHQAIDAG